MILDPKGIGNLVGLLFLLVMCYICFQFNARAQQQKQQQKQTQEQHQQVIVQTSDKKMRVCPKCGMQNDVTNRFCSDCAYDFKKPNDKPS